MFSTGIAAPWASLRINVYDENTSSSISYWDVFISNEDGSVTYESLQNNNTLTIDINDLPYGENTIIVINASGYDSKVFYMDLEVNENYVLDAFLSFLNATELYVFFVVNEFDDPIKNVEINIKRYINDTVGYQNVSILNSDASGQVMVHLIPLALYLFELSKTGYETETSMYTPDPDYHGVYYPTTFQLLFTREEPVIITPSDVIDFNATITASGVITVWYTDKNSHTTNTEIKIYEYHNGSLTWNYTDTRSGDNSFTFTDTGYNISMMHKIILYVNHSDLADTFAVLYVYLYPIRTVVEEIILEDRFTDVFGSFELGYVKTFLIFIPCVFFLVVFGAAHTGLGILISGLYLGFSTFMLDISQVTIGGQSAFIVIASLLAVTGFLIIILRKGRHAI